MSACAIAFGAVSALGRGADAVRPADAAGAPRIAVARDEAFARARLGRPLSARVPWLAAEASALGVDPATLLLREALAAVLARLDAVRPGWRAERIGVAVGTSSGGMLSAEAFFAARADGRIDDARALARRATYFAPLDDALEAMELPVPAERRTHVLAACAASTIAIGVAARWLARGACDVVLAGGYDALSVFVASGFEALRAITASEVRPFRAGRDGMVLGEGAALIALVRDEDLRGARPHFHVAGFGAATDAVHITAPDRSGAGLARAALAALADAGVAPDAIGIVSAHATATPYNDAMESKAIATALGDARRPVVHPFKAQIGHTLGAAGALETLAAASCLEERVAPPAAGSGELDPDAPARLLARGEPSAVVAALKLSAAFGGANAALVLTTEPTAGRTRPPRAVHLRAWARAVAPDLAALSAATGVPRDRLARLDVVCRLGVAAVSALAEQVGAAALRGAGIVAGHALATIDTNDRFDARRRERGPSGVEPRVFPATSPNALAGECAIIWGLTGPSFAVAAGLGGAREALARGAELVAAGDADRIVVVAADDAGPVARDLLELSGLGGRRFEAGAVALLLDANPARAVGTVALDPEVHHDVGPIGHLALLEWLEAR